MTINMRTGKKLKLAEPEAPPLQLRESNKADKRERIRKAAMDLFSRQGFDETTMRQIARSAKVALGTLSLYADDKSDLALMIFVEKAQSLNLAAEAAATRKSGLIEKLVALFAVFAEDAAKDITLTRINHRLSYRATGRHGAEYHALREQLFGMIEKILREAHGVGEISTSQDLQFVARQVFFNFSAGMRWWIAGPSPNVALCLKNLRDIMTLLVYGMRPAAELPKKKRNPR